jgi:hypothetical protein
LSDCQFSADLAMECWKYVPDSCSKFIEVVRVVVSLVLIALHPIGLDLNFFGAVAQLGERLICIQEVAGSIPTSSTMSEQLWP